MSFDDTWGKYFAERYGTNWREKRLFTLMSVWPADCNCWFCRMTPEQIEDWHTQHGGEAKR